MMASVKQGLCFRVLNIGRSLNEPCMLEQDGRQFTWVRPQKPAILHSTTWGRSQLVRWEDTGAVYGHNATPGGVDTIPRHPPRTALSTAGAPEMQAGALLVVERSHLHSRQEPPCRPAGADNGLCWGCRWFCLDLRLPR